MTLGNVWTDRKQFDNWFVISKEYHKTAKADTEIVSAGALVYNVARKKEAGKDFISDTAMAKLLHTRRKLLRASADRLLSR